MHWELLLFFLVIAFVYASVGFGGGSSYLAVLALYATPFAEMKLTALICNIIVVTGGTLLFISKKQVDWKKVLPLLLSGIPMSFLGARMKLSQDAFFVILGISLVAAAILLWIKTRSIDDAAAVRLHKPNVVKEILLGGSIGLLSGMVGIGGGIFLSPVLNLTQWDTPRKIAATASLYILLNSIFGIVGQLSVVHTGINYTHIGLLCAVVLIGGQLGSRMGAIKFNPLVIRRLTALLVFFAGIEVLFKHLAWFK